MADPAPDLRSVCGLASALEGLGERWTLLTERELLIGPRPVH
jgi:hypothetical protein